MQQGSQQCIQERDGSLVYQTGDYELFARRALELPQATHFAAYGHRDTAKWFHPAARTRETPLIAAPEVIPRNDKWGRFYGCRLDAIAREPVTRFILKCSRKRRWPGAVLWHWWLYSDDDVLLSLYDWPDIVLLDRDFDEWAQARLGDGSLVPRPQLGD